MKLPSFIVLLRIPFSFFLAPVFLFAFAFAQQIDVYKATELFIVLHLFIYPASNGFNSFMDKDETSIGGLRHPPQPTQALLIVSMLFNVIGVSYTFFMNPLLGYLTALYVLVSIAYSWHVIRLKKHPILSFLSVIIFQGFVVYTMVYLFCQTTDYLHAMLQNNYLIPALISTLMVAGAYPMTQVYQHKADKKSGDNTLSRMLGIKGTFQFCSLINLSVLAWMGIFLTGTKQSHLFYLFLCFIFPVLAFFVWWATKVWEDESQANFRYTMILNRVSATCMVLYFILVYLMRGSDGIPVY
ncbi:MAG: hypothetical protein CFE21_01515 [Bacteroidetes bacterium B1(2017)]|nr:MAG: hypothetical protein CFE21_01515 [Bacteroidetes bacterium B1(2017)]